MKNYFWIYAFILTLCPGLVLGHTEEVKETPTVSTNRISLPSVKEAWASIQNSAKKIENSLASTNLDQIHEWQEKLNNDLDSLKTNSSQVIGDQAKRLEAALKQAKEISENVHQSADDKLIEPTKREFEKLKSALELVKAQYSKDDLSSTEDHMDHEMGPTNNLSSSGITFVIKPSTGPLKIGDKAEVIMQFKKQNGSLILLNDLKEVHTKKIHLLIIDSSLTDYHHVHPTVATNSGEFQFSFIPKKPGFYRVWADITPVTTDQEEYLISDLAAETKGEPITDRKPNFVAKVDDLTLNLSFDKNPLKVGQPALGKLKIVNDKGEVFSQLEPVMGAYAHLVGFSEDYQTIAHIHPMGTEPTKATDRGTGELTFHLVPKKPGLIRLFAQIRIKGEDKFAAFTLFAPAESD